MKTTIKKALLLALLNVLIINVLNAQNPILTPQTHNDITIYVKSEVICLLPNYTGSVTATNSENKALTIVQSPQFGTEIQVGTTVVTLTATDGDYSTSLDFNYIIIEDNTPPYITSELQSIVIFQSDKECTLKDYTDNLEAIDKIDSNLSITQSPAIGTKLKVGSNHITLTATDDAGNSSSKSFDLIIYEDLTKPKIIVGNEIILDVSNSCSAILPNYLAIIEITDNCAGEITTSQVPEAGTKINAKLNSMLVSITATDESGNIATKDINVKIIGETNTITNIKDLPILFVENNFEIIEYPTATINCLNEIEATTENDLIFTETGTYNIEWVFTDDFGDTKTQNQKVIVYEITEDGSNLYINIDDGYTFKWYRNDILIEGENYSDFIAEQNGTYYIEIEKDGVIFKSKNLIINFLNSENTVYTQTISPIPSNGNFTVKNFNNYNMDIVDVSGNTIYKTDINKNDVDINLSNKGLKGVYFILFKSGHKKIIKKLIIN
ncbi:MAG: HYR domain-containing protein [Ichthyobacteriaceae bacterium]|nr:HYR domain-containing protein [Ichthyobacteriaceae bacterium]